MLSTTATNWISSEYLYPSRRNRESISEVYLLDMEDASFISEHYWANLSVAYLYWPYLTIRRSMITADEKSEIDKQSTGERQAVEENGGGSPKFGRQSDCLSDWGPCSSHSPQSLRRHKGETSIPCAIARPLISLYIFSHFLVCTSPVSL